MITKPLAFASNLTYNISINSIMTEKMSLIDRMEYYKIPALSLAYINNDHIDWVASYGFIDFEKTIPCTHNTIFQAASISKMVTALGVLKLVQEQVLCLDEDINSYLKTWQLPESPFITKNKVTLRALLSHTAGTTVSGFPGYAVDSPLPTLTQILDGHKPIANNDPVLVFQKPGSKFKYSGGGTCIIQKIIEDQTNMPFHIWMKKEILDKLEMSASTFEQPLPNDLYKVAAHGYSNGAKVTGSWHVYPEQAAAGLWTTPTDLAKLAIFIHSTYKGQKDTFIQCDLIQEMLRPQILINGKLYSGLGSFIKKTSSNDFIFEHSGGNCGFSALLHIHSESGSGVVIMMPGDLNAWYLKQEILNAMAHVYNWPERQVIFKSDQLFDTSAYKHIVGKYQAIDDADDIAEVFTNNNEIYFKLYPEAFAIRLYLEQANQFFSREEDQTFTFKHDENSWQLIVDYHTEQIWGQQAIYLKI